MRMTGRCLCGAVQFSLNEKPLWQGHCHCESCRRACGAGFVSWIGIRDGAWELSGATLKPYLSSPGVTRQFCGNCGTQMSFASARWPQETHFLAANLDEPERFAPTVHFHHDERLSWVPTDPGLKIAGLT